MIGPECNSEIKEIAKYNPILLLKKRTFSGEDKFIDNFIKELKEYILKINLKGRIIFISEKFLD